METPRFDAPSPQNIAEPKPKPIRERDRIFVHIDLDQLGLDPYEFRIYGHIARRRTCFVSLDKMADACCMSVRKAQYALQVLHRAGLIDKETRKGRANTFKVAKPSRWRRTMNKEKLANIRKAVKAGKAPTEKLGTLDSVPY